MARHRDNNELWRDLAVMIFMLLVALAVIGSGLWVVYKARGS